MNYKNTLIFYINNINNVYLIKLKQISKYLNILKMIFIIKN